MGRTKALLFLEPEHYSCIRTVTVCVFVFVCEANNCGKSLICKYTHDSRSTSHKTGINQKSLNFKFVYM